MLPRRSLTLIAAATIAGSLAVASTPGTSALSTADVLPNRSAEAVVLTGAQIPGWSRLPAVGAPNPQPGPMVNVRDAHNGTLQVPADVRKGIDANQLVAYKWQGGRKVQIPVQVDQRFPYFLANANSDFGIYSGTDTELTYQWDTEAWNMTEGQCTKAHPAGVTTMKDPVATLDDDDEIVFMASDAGKKAPAGGIGGVFREVTITDPTTGAQSYVYLAVRPIPTPSPTSYVSYVRDANADQWIDKNSFPSGSTEQLGSSNGGYGPNLSGSVCDPDGTVRASTDRFPRDGVTVTTSKYQWHASGRWMVRSMRVTAPNGTGYGPDLIDRWKGRAFQSSPDSTISVVGFEDEQVNWEANSSLLGERVGPVRAIRETWGADSGTNVTKTETFYRDAITYRYRMRVHPIPPDGLYTSWDYNHGVATKYYNALHPEGVDIDGVNDDVGQVDSIGGQPAFFDAPDPRMSVPLTMDQWEQVSGHDSIGSLVYVLESKGATTFENPAVVPYYRDDACFDDGTGDDPVARPQPGEASTDQRVMDGYAALYGKPYDQVTCAEKQGAWGEHGVHYFATNDTDNAFVGSPAPLTEVDAQQWQFAVPTSQPGPVGEPYAQVVRVPLVAVVSPV